MTCGDGTASDAGAWQCRWPSLTASDTTSRRLTTSHGAVVSDRAGLVEHRVSEPGAITRCLTGAPPATASGLTTPRSSDQTSPPRSSVTTRRLDVIAV